MHCLVRAEPCRSPMLTRPGQHRHDPFHGSIPKAEVVVYWAIADLCPDEMGQRQYHWRDGNYMTNGPGSRRCLSNH